MVCSTVTDPTKTHDPVGFLRVGWMAVLAMSPPCPLRVMLIFLLIIVVVFRRLDFLSAGTLPTKLRVSRSLC